MVAAPMQMLCPCHVCMYLGALHPEICVCEHLSALHPEICCVCTVIYIIYKKTKHFFRSFFIWPYLAVVIATFVPAAC